MRNGGYKPFRFAEERISKSALFAADAIHFFGEADLRDVVMTKKCGFQVCACTVFNIKKCGAHTTLKSC